MKGAAPGGRAASSVRSVQEWIEWTRRRLTRASLVFGHGAPSAASEALWLVAHVLHVGFDAIAAAPDRKLSAPASRRLEALVRRRIEQRLPLAYLLGEAWLAGHRFLVDERVIVPRSFIAELLDDRLTPWVRPVTVRRILDLCTGSGCLAILAALAFRNSTVDAVDLSAAALAVATQNVRAYRLGQRIRLLEGDLLEPLGKRRYDLILANPPYVDLPAMRKLPAEYRAEPRLALSGGHDGLRIVERIIEGSGPHLNPGGFLVMEIGHHRSRFERAYPDLPCVWLDTAGGSDHVLLVAAADLPRHTA